MENQPAEPLKLSVLILPAASGYTAICLETSNAVSELDPESAAKSVTELIDGQLSAIKRGVSLDSMLHK